MDDLEFRRQAIINPFELNKDLSKKLNKGSKQNNLESVDNKRLLEEQLEFEQQLQSTLDIPVPDNLAEKILFSQVTSNADKNKHKRYYVFAAVVAMVVLSGFLLFDYEKFNNHNTPNLSEAVLNHIYEDSHALDTYREYSKVDVNTALASMGGKLAGPIGNISYLSRCIMGKNIGLHMVVRTQTGLVTVLLLPHEVVSQGSYLADDNYSGFIFPSKKGAVVIIGDKNDKIKNHSERSNKDIIRERVEKNLRWII